MPGPSYAGRLGNVERISRGVLPPTLSWILSSSTIEDDELERASRYLGRRFDLPLKWFLRPAKSESWQFRAYQNPWGEGVITARAGRKMIEGLEDDYIRDYLVQSVRTTIPPKREPLDPWNLRATTQQFIDDNVASVAAIFGVPAKSARLLLGDLPKGVLGQSLGPFIAADTPYLVQSPEDTGLLIHEIAHRVTQPQGKMAGTQTDTGWLREGLADYARDVLGYGGKPERGNPAAGYQQTAHFLLWMNKIYPGSVVRVVQALRGRAGSADEALYMATKKSRSELFFAYRVDKTFRPSLPDRPSRKRFLTILDGLMPLIGEEINFGHALSIAGGVLKSGAAPDLFLTNMSAVLRTTFANEPLKGIAHAAEAARRGISIGGPADLQAFLSGVTPEELGSLAEANRLIAEQGIEPVTKMGVLAALPDLTKAIGNTETSYNEEAEKILDELRIKASQKSVGDVVFGGLLSTLQVLNRPFDVAARFALDPDTYLDPFGKSKGRFNIAYALDDSWDILTGDTSIYDIPHLKNLGVGAGDIMTVQLGLAFATNPGASFRALATTKGATRIKAGLRLGGDLVVDPLTTLLRVGGATASKRWLFMLSDEGRANVIQRFLFSKVRKLGNEDVRHFLVSRALSESDPEKMYVGAVGAFRDTFGRPGIEPLTSRAIWDFVRRGKRAGLSGDEMADGVGDLFAQSFGMAVPEDSLAHSIRSAMDATQQQAEGRILPKLADEHIYNLAQVERRKLAQAGAILDDFDEQIVRFGPKMHEIPRFRTLRLGAKSDGPIARAGGALKLQDVPTRRGPHFVFLPDHDVTDAVEAFDKVLTRGRVFTEAEKSHARLILSRAMKPTLVSRESAMSNVLERYSDAIYERIGKQYGATKEQAKKLTEAGMPGGGPKEQVFAAPVREGFPLSVTHPLRPEQLRNIFFVPDPVFVRQALKGYVGTWRAGRNAVRNVLGKDIPPALKARFSLSAIYREAIPSGPGRRLYGVWRRSVVWKAGYIFKVVLGDEMNRFLSMRGAANRLRAGKTFAKLARKGTDTAELELRTGLSREEAVKLALPGLLDPEPLANTGALSVAFGSTDIGSKELEEAIFTSWKSVARESVEPEVFASSWHRALFQYTHDDIGREMLKLRAAGLDEETAINRLLGEFYPSEAGQETVRRMRQVPGWNAEDATRIDVEYLWQITPHEEVAFAALDGTLSARMLQAIPPDVQPLFVHGPALRPMGASKTLGKWMNALVGAILEQPTNRLIRQPFFHDTYAEMYAFLREQVIDAGRTIDDALDGALKREARAFAVRQTKTVMFDFARTSRMSELLWFVSPFFNPFTEFFRVWPRVIRHNPAMIAHVYRLSKGAYESGFLRYDKDTGQIVVPVSWWAGAAPLLAMVTGGKLEEKGAGGGWQLAIPLSSLNIFASNAFPLEVGGGTIPIPTPGFSPPAQWALQGVIGSGTFQKLAGTDAQARMLSWITEFGEVSPKNPASILPAWMRHALAGYAPEWFQQQADLNTNHFLLVQQAMGQEPDAELARKQAQEFSYLRAFFAFVMPAAPKIDFPTDALEREWRTLVDTKGYTDALDEWLGTWNPATKAFEGGLHPDLTLIPIAKTMWADDRIPFPLPATQAGQRILATKGAQRFAEDYPEWLWAIVPRELREGELDLGIFFAQLQQGLREVRSPTQFQEAGERTLGWEAYFAVREQWLAWQQAHPDLATGDASYDERKNEYDAAIEDVGAIYPGWHADFTTFELKRVANDVMRKSRALARSEEFTKTDAGAGLVEYLQLRDPIEAELSKANISSLDTVAAERLGFVKRYEDGIAAIFERHPDFEIAWRLFFTGDLRNVRTAYEKLLDTIPEDVFDGQITPWQEEFEKLKDGPSAGMTDAEVRQAWLDLRVHSDSAYDFPKEYNPLELWWKSPDVLERKEYFASLATKPTIFYSRFDWSRIGLPSDGRSAKAWAQIEAARAQIELFEGMDPSFSSTDARENLDTMVRVFAGSSKRFAKQLAAANTWGYALQQAIPKMFITKESGRYWDSLFGTVHSYQFYAERQEMRGVDDFDQEKKVLYRQMRDSYLVSYVNYLRGESVAFDHQWKWLEERTDDPLVNYLMPDIWFRLGGTD